MPTRRWQVAGLLAALAALGILLAPRLKGSRAPPTPVAPDSGPPASTATYVGSERCGSCHQAEFGKWKGSHHGLAMQPASDGTVLGDFKDSTFELRGLRWRFFRQGSKFMVAAEGPDGKLHDYQVTYTFGVDPLQQYLIPFPGGRMQALSVAWDTRAKRWFFLYPGQDIPPTDWLHWTRQGQNWNGMCADCHSTNLKKGYDPDQDTFQTTWSEVMVGCEACHGPGSLHAAWANQPAEARAKVEHEGLVNWTSTRSSNREQVAMCATCHARRAQFEDQGPAGGKLLDRYLPVLLAPGVFHADGQIQAEDYEYHSFTQSKMYANNVCCSDCHDVHSGNRLSEGNALCLRCHKADKYDAAVHHHHDAKRRDDPRSGAQCTSCHMPGQNYMVVHFRRDHSLRVPRPDVSMAVGSPDACAGCHADKPRDWVWKKYQGLWGKDHGPHFGTVLADGRKGKADAEADLALLARAEVFPAVARATALDLLGGYRGEASTAALELALADPDPLLRRTAAFRLTGVDPYRLAHDLTPLLADPIRAVRTEAAARLAELPAQAVPESARGAQATALGQYVEDQRYMSDLPSGAYNLGNLYAAQGNQKEAEAQYRRALRVDDKLYPAKVNLAMLLAEQEGHKAEAEELLRSVHAAQPQLADVAFDLGLLLAEEGKRAEAEKVLRAALRVDPGMAAAAFNLSVLVGDHDPKEGAECARRAAALRPGEPRYAWTQAFYQAKSGDAKGAVATLRALLKTHPTYPDAYPLLGELYQRLGRTEDALALYERAQGIAELPEDLRTKLALQAHALQAR
jgi:tetratricopeptide (TPR) repeat protein